MANDDRQSLEAIQADTSFFGHPRGLATLFFTEMWERFSYYGMRAILILYMVDKVAHGGLGFPDAKAGSVYGLYTSMVYLLCLGGGWIADRVTGQRRAVLLGGIFIAAGEFCLVTPSEISFYAGLVLLMMGTGLLKGNVSTIVGQLYAKTDVRRDSGFSIFYMGINTGALIAPIICGWVGERISWRWGFGLAGLGMLAGLIQYALGGKHLGTAGLHPAGTGSPELDRKQRNSALVAIGVILGVVALVAILSAMGIVPITATDVGDALGWIELAIAVVVFSWLLGGSGWSADERSALPRYWCYLWRRRSFGRRSNRPGRHSICLPNATPIARFPFPNLSMSFRQAGFKPSAGIRRGVVTGICLDLVSAGASQEGAAEPREIRTRPAVRGTRLRDSSATRVAPSVGEQAAMWWLIGTYLLQTLGELCLSPIGLSATSKLAPDRAAGFMMGIWFLSIAIGNWLAGNAVSFSVKMSMPTLFGAVAAFSVGAALVLALLIKPTVKLMSGVK